MREEWEGWVLTRVELGRTQSDLQLSPRSGREDQGAKRLMKQSQQPGTTQSDRFSYSRPQVFRDLFRNASSQTLAWTGVAVAVAWLPLALLSALRGGGSFQSFLTDYATQSRFLIIIPVLILSAPSLHERRVQVAEHIEKFLVPREQYPEFHADWTSSDKLRNSWLAHILIAVLAYATVIWLDQYLSPQGIEFTAWWKGGGGLRFMSLAGTWAAFVSYPIVVYLGFLWLWRQLLWLRFLRLTTRLDLQLIAAHPDGLGGLGFLEGALRAQLPFAFCLGVGLAGAIANRVFHDGQKLVAFRHLPVILIAAVLAHLCRSIFPVHQHADANAAPCHVKLRSLCPRGG